ncbi:hypothetical protein [Faecalimicrobium sp. JNUCC 81]
MKGLIFIKKENYFKKLQKLIWIDIGIFTVVYIIGAIILEVFKIPINSILAWLILGGIPIFLVISVYSKLVKFPYECRNCYQVFNIKFRDMFALHTGDTRRLKCPFCNKTTWAKIKID